MAQATVLQARSNEETLARFEQLRENNRQKNRRILHQMEKAEAELGGKEKSWGESVGKSGTKEESLYPSSMVSNNLPFYGMIIDLTLKLIPGVRLFGGAVRDLLRDEQPKDLDFLLPTNSNQSSDHEEELEQQLAHLQSILQIIGYQVSTIRKNRLFSPHELPSIEHGDGIKDGEEGHYGLISWEIVRQSATNQPPTSLKVDWVFEIVTDGADFTCNMLTYNHRQELGFWTAPDSSNPTLPPRNSVSFLPILAQVLNDIHLKRLRLVQADYFLLSEKHRLRPRGPIERREAARLFQRSVKMIGRGWQPEGWCLADLGFQFTVQQYAQPTHQSSAMDITSADLEAWLAEVEQLVDLEVRVPVPKSSLEESQEEETCPICLEKMLQLEKTLIKTGCGHNFHFECLYPHLRKVGDCHSQCPVCRQELEA